MIAELMLFKKKIRYRFRADSIWIEWDRNNKKQLAMICVSDVINNTDIVHPLTDFIYKNWRYNSYNTQRKHAIN
ncbi:hypothetical protein AM598_09345, partial [Paenibacillus polymyxa]